MPAPVRVGVIGARGRMGATVCAAVAHANDMELVAAVDPAAKPADDAGVEPTGGSPSATQSGPSPVVSAGLEALVESGAQVAVDFTVPSAVVANAEFCAANGIHCVIGTTGIDDSAIEHLTAAFPASGPTGCLVAPNFAIGAVLMVRFAELAAPWFETAEIIELHHDRKVDAPSGTALQTAARMAAARTPDARTSDPRTLDPHTETDHGEGPAAGQWGADPTEVEVYPGARGGIGPAGIHIHSVRLRGLVAHQEVVLGTTGQTLTIRHDSIDRESFMPGVLAAVRQISGRPGLTVGLDRLLGI